MIKIDTEQTITYYENELKKSLTCHQKETIKRHLFRLKLDRFDSRFKKSFASKVNHSCKLMKKVIDEYNNHSCVSCSFGKDSTVLVHLACKIKPNILVAFANTGVEYPETLAFRDLLVEQWNLNYVEVKPEKTFWQCLPKGQIVLTSTVPKAIEDIKIGDLVLTHNGNFEKVLSVFKRKYSGEVIEIYPQYNYRPLVVTPEHPILVSKGYHLNHDISDRIKPQIHLVWIEAKNVKPNYKIVRPAPKEEKRPTYSKELLTLIGYYLSEGSLEKYRVRFNFGIHEKEFIDETANLIMSCFGIDASIYEHKDRNICQVGINSKDIAIFFKNFGVGALNKRMTPDILFLAKNMIIYLLRSLWNGDGYIYNSSNKMSLSYSSVSETLILQMRELIYKLGIIPCLSIRNGSNVIQGRNVSAHELYTISVEGWQAEKLARFLKVYDRKLKRERLRRSGFFYNDMLFFPIRRIHKRQFSGFVYNLHVETVNSYIAENISVHNCVREYGYPSIRYMGREAKKQGKYSGVPKCCYYLKEKPMKIFYKEHEVKAVFLGLTADESYTRKWTIIRYNDLYKTKKNCPYEMVKCHPLAYWTEEEIWRYTKENNLPISKIYEFADRNGCMPCTGYLSWKEKMSKINPKLYRKIIKDMIGSNLDDWA